MLQVVHLLTSVMDRALDVHGNGPPVDGESVQGAARHAGESVGQQSPDPGHQSLLQVPVGELSARLSLSLSLSLCLSLCLSLALSLSLTLSRFLCVSACLYACVQCSALNTESKGPQVSVTSSVFCVNCVQNKDRNHREQKASFCHLNCITQHCGLWTMC